MAECRSCHAEIEWATTEGGKPMPLDVGERADGNLVVVERAGGRGPIVRYVKPGRGTRVSHFATCENAAQHRKT